MLLGLLYLRQGPGMLEGLRHLCSGPWPPSRLQDHLGRPHSAALPSVGGRRGLLTDQTLILMVLVPHPVPQLLSENSLMLLGDWLSAPRQDMSSPSLGPYLQLWEGPGLQASQRVWPHIHLPTQHSCLWRPLRQVGGALFPRVCVYMI